MAARKWLLIAGIMVGCVGWLAGASSGAGERQTEVSIDGERFLINGRPTYEGVVWTTSDGREFPVEGLLMNARLVQGIFDDLNPETMERWAYPDTDMWDAGRNTREYVDAMAGWYEHGLRSFVINLQGGSPEGYSQEQPWHNSAFRADGSLRDAYLDRLERILDRADELGMVAIVGYFYFGQDHRLQDERAVVRAVDEATRWILERGYRNVLVEINNECNIHYDHAILQPPRVAELIERVQRTEHEGRRLLASTSYSGGVVPDPHVVGASDFVLLHGNGVRDPNRMVEMIRQVRAMNEYQVKPIVNNEDDRPWRDAHQGWGEDGNNFVACVQNYASWGYFDFREPHESGDFNQGFQSVPVNWQISSERKRAFFDLLAEITGSPGTPRVELEVRSTGDAAAGEAEVRVDRLPEGAEVRRVELRWGDEVLGSTCRPPYAFELRETESAQVVRGRVIYYNGSHEVIVESPAGTLPVASPAPGR